MAFENVKNMGAWGVAFAGSVILHVAVLGLLLGMRGCGSQDGYGPPLPQTDGRAEAPPPRADGAETPQTHETPSAQERPAKAGRPDKAEAKRPVKPEARAASEGESPAADVPAGWKTYKVRPGDSLTRIARQCGCTVHELARANGLSPTANLRLGQTLKVKDAPAD